MRRLLPAILLGALACESAQAPERDRDAPLQTGRLSYAFVAGEGGYVTTPEIRIALRNTTGGAAVLLGGLRDAADLALEQLVDGAWVVRYRKSLPDGIRRVRRIQPGGTAMIRTTIDGNLPGTCDCVPILDLEDGVYRFRIEEGYVDAFDDESEEPGEELPEEHRVSNRFALDAP